MSVQTMAAVWKGSQHSGSALLMMLAIADFSDDKGFAFPSVATLAEKTRMRPRNANYLLSELQRSGELSIRLGAGRSGTNLYRILLDRLEGLQQGAGLHPSAGVQAAAGLQPSARGAAPSCTPPLQPSADKPSLNHQEPSDTSAAADARSEIRSPNCPYEQVVSAYHEILPELPRVKMLDAEGRKEAIAKRWKWLFTSTKPDGSRRAGTAEEALAWLRRFFERARKNDFLMGHVERTGAHKGWQCDLDFLMSRKGLKQVVELTEESH